MYDWNFETNTFRRDGNGRMILLSQNDALKIWIIKTLHTERYVWLAYSRRYGIELYVFLNKVMAVGERKSEMKRMITEALMCNPYLKSIDSLEFTDAKHGEDLTVNITLTTIYGQLTV